VPKTGGKTISDNLRWHLQRDRDYLHLRVTAKRRQRQTAFEVVESLDPASRKQLLAIIGHPVSRRFVELFPDRPVREVVFVREPAARIVSHYNFRVNTALRRKKEAPTFEKFLERIGPNAVTRFLSERLGVATNGPSQLSDLLQELAKFWMVGVTENLDQRLPTLFNAMGLPADVPPRGNVTGITVKRHLLLTPGLRDELQASNPLDMMLFDACKRLE